VASRLATEKGVEYLVKALPAVIEKFPTARVLFAGQYQDVLGEEAYAQKLAPLINELGEHWTFLGILPAEEFSAFFHATEVTVLPSINSTESFGMVQVESMTCGTPVISTDLPGVRQPIKLTGMGRTIPPRDPDELSKALIEILSDPIDYAEKQEKVKNQFSPSAIAEQYEALFEQLLQN
jgi:glycosyltransferase involved in cell wall biosynthesis